MKYSQLIGVLACLGLFTISFFPWVYIPSLNLTLDGFHGSINDKLSFGKQGVTHGFFLVFLTAFFLLNKVWAKRANIYIAMLNLGWAIKNFLLFSTCRPECPQKQPALYLLVFFAIVIQVMTFLPKIEVPVKSE